ncbi:hypothetical protein TVAG_121730 [Trichomonas vaginalis G3]|uniref:Uncharacterized protein n=1 Tax=Trichomonas vaginalis (strain ATCC PRA-98 / G3) TaxID=412133 RepID=A2E984_TRIV3|nr:hypothetical protein TVAGG3_0421490 [Trichomonas vaginalis G3]EAY10769.1 hypothetical protein TVAG_121730 [Trichomonas vaginalis G3]KAI5536093.1 hypothetical protein TVAGG3_0421490 [Trichomonas vaginalis G3]|eukprot:XP_001322992.1 hypothetical protein [Trichomonas vaginalis G3]
MNDNSKNSSNNSNQLTENDKKQNDEPNKTSGETKYVLDPNLLKSGNNINKQNSNSDQNTKTTESKSDKPNQNTKFQPYYPLFDIIQEKSEKTPENSKKFVTGYVDDNHFVFADEFTNNLIISATGKKQRDIPMDYKPSSITLVKDTILVTSDKNLNIFNLEKLDSQTKTFQNIVYAKCDLNMQNYFYFLITPNLYLNFISENQQVNNDMNFQQTLVYDNVLQFDFSFILFCILDQNFKLTVFDRTESRFVIHSEILIDQNNVKIYCDNSNVYLYNFQNESCEVINVFENTRVVYHEVVNVISSNYKVILIFKTKIRIENEEYQIQGCKCALQSNYNRYIYYNAQKIEKTDLQFPKNPISYKELNLENFFQQSNSLVSSLENKLSQSSSLLNPTLQSAKSNLNTFSNIILNSGLICDSLIFLFDKNPNLSLSYMRNHPDRSIIKFLTSKHKEIIKCIKENSISQPILISILPNLLSVCQTHEKFMDIVNQIIEGIDSTDYFNCFVISQIYDNLNQFLDTIQKNNPKLQDKITNYKDFIQKCQNNFSSMEIDLETF